MLRLVLAGPIRFRCPSNYGDQKYSENQYGDKSAKFGIVIFHCALFWRFVLALLPWRFTIFNQVLKYWTRRFCVPLNRDVPLQHRQVNNAG